MRSIRNTATCLGFLLVLGVLLVGVTGCDSDGGGGDDDVSSGADTATQSDAGADIVTGDDTAPPSDAPPPDDAGEPICPCPDDGILCTADECDDSGVCQHEQVNVVTGAVIGFTAPEFTLVDVNPESATSGQTLSLTDFAASDTVVILAFHAADCESCQEQGKAARDFWSDIQDDPEVFFAAVNTPTAAESVMDYVNADPATVEGPAPPSTWAVLQDTEDADVWGRYCADTDWVVIVDVDGHVQYMREVNFSDAPFLTELQTAIVGAKAPEQPAE